MGLFDGQPSALRLSWHRIRPLRGLRNAGPRERAVEHALTARAIKGGKRARVGQLRGCA
jgi:hypothetical protein